MAERPTLTTSSGMTPDMQSAVREIVVAANEEALNTAITENQIQPEKIISVILQPAKHLAVGDDEAKYRVLYRV